MNAPRELPEDDTLHAAAAQWIVRRDRGLSAAESIEFELWLAEDERRAAAIDRLAGAWSRLDRIPDRTADAVLAGAARRRSFWRRTAAATVLAAAAALTVTAIRWKSSPRSIPESIAAAPSQVAEPRSVMLSDGSVVALNTEGEIEAQFTAGERRVRLVRGDAHFSVVKDPARPFVVTAGSVDVGAVGTAFYVHLQSAAVEVLVTEGVVKLNPSAGNDRAEEGANAIPLLSPGQRAVVALSPVSAQAAVAVTSVSSAEMSRALAWKEPLVRLGGATLAEVVANFEQRTGRRVVLADPAIAGLRLGGRFRADDIDGFAHLLSATLEIEVERTVEGTLILRKKVSNSR